jgi:hypothetical protein
MAEVTPWEEARSGARIAAHIALTDLGLFLSPTETEAALNAVLRTLSRAGYAVVPKVATLDMVKARIAAHGTWALEINAAIEAGDVLRVKP